MNGPLDDLFGNLLGPQAKPRVEKGVQWEAKVIDGQYYVPLRQVAELLAANSALPKVAEGIRRRVAKGPA